MFSDRKLGEELDALWQDHAAWSASTFGPAGPEGALKHLAKEATEALAEAASGTHAALTVELADCLLLLLDASRRAGLDPLALVRAAAAKMVVNKARKWPSPVPGQPCEHIEEKSP